MSQLTDVERSHTGTHTHTQQTCQPCTHRHTHSSHSHTHTAQSGELGARRPGVLCPLRLCSVTLSKVACYFQAFSGSCPHLPLPRS